MANRSTNTCKSPLDVETALQNKFSETRNEETAARVVRNRSFKSTGITIESFSLFFFLFFSLASVRHTAVQRWSEARRSLKNTRSKRKTGSKGLTNLLLRQPEGLLEVLVNCLLGGPLLLQSLPFHLGLPLAFTLLQPGFRFSPLPAAHRKVSRLHDRRSRNTP